jgi:hypothetical protein
MQNLYSVHINNVGQVSVDVFSPRRKSPNKWRAYFALQPASMARVRRLYAQDKKRFYVSREWSYGRWRMYKEWCSQWGNGGQGRAGTPFPH